MQFKYKYEVGNDGEAMVGTGDMLEIAVHTARQAQIVYSRMKSRDAGAAEKFKTMMTVMIAEPNSPVWNDDVKIGTGIDCFTIKRGKER